MTYLCITLLIILVLALMVRLVFITKIFKNFKQKNMAALADFQAQIDSMTTSVTTLGTNIDGLNTKISDLNGQLANGLSETDANTVLSGIQTVASNLSSLVTSSTPAPVTP